MRRLTTKTALPAATAFGVACALAAGGCGGDSSGGIEKPAKYQDAPKGLKISGAGGAPGPKGKEGRGVAQTPE